MSSPHWTIERPNARPSSRANEYLERLDESGALAESEVVFDSIDAGVNPYADGVTYDELVRRAREITG